MRFGDSFTCLYCLMPESYTLRADKHGRPYFACIACGAKTFLRGAPSLKGPALLWGPLSSALLNNDAAAARVILNDAATVKHDPALQSTIEYR